MTREEYLAELFEVYSPISVLSDKNGCRVIKVKHKSLDRYMVVRSFSEKVAAYNALFGIRFENLPLIYDLVELDDGQIVLEEFIEGLTVAQVMETGCYRYLGTRRVLRGVCRALTVLHERGIVHRDLKPENIIIGKDGRVVLIDFNAARQVSAATKDTVILGTVGYASPEQLGITQSDQRSDIYAAGILLNVMITGKHPSEKIAKGKAGRIVRKCTSVNPDQRFDSAEKLAAAL